MFITSYDIIIIIAVRVILPYTEGYCIPIMVTLTSPRNTIQHNDKRLSYHDCADIAFWINPRRQKIVVYYIIMNFRR